MDIFLLPNTKMKLLLVIYLYVVFNTVVFTKNVKIIGGTVARTREFTYIASLRYLNGIHFCAGVIVSKLHILTVAHCFNTSKSLSNVKIYTGTTLMNSFLGSVYGVRHLEMYPDFTGGMTHHSKALHDIAIITVDRCIKFNAYQNKIDLPQKDIAPNTEAIVSGWGTTEYPSIRLSIQLRKAYMRILSNSECIRLTGFNIHEEQLCAYQKLGVGSCDGDSGGPLVSNGKLIGLVSFAIPCATGKPDVYTRVYSYLSFIKSFINKSCLKFCS